MKIREYKIIHDELKHPKLWEAHVYNWNGNNFSSYDNIVKMINHCFRMSKLNEEYVYVLSFNYHLDLLGVFELSHGTTKTSWMNTKELYCFLLLTGADQFIVVHNHPNGDLNISEDDYQVSSNINAFSTLLNFNMIESIIVSNKGYCLIKKDQLDKFNGGK